MGKKEHEALLLILIIALLAALDYRVLPLLLGADCYLYFFKPLIWLGLTVYVWSRPLQRFKGKLKLYNYILMWSTICAIIYICFYFGAGFIDGIGLSPYTKKWQGIILNLVSLGSVLAMMEYVRNYVLNLVKKKYFLLFALFTVFIFLAYRLNLRLFLSIQSWQQAVQYAGEYLLPELMTNALLTYFVYLGGAFPAIIYILLISLPQWLVPYLPDLKWITKAFIGIILPLIFIITVRQAYQYKARKIKLRELEEYNPKTWIAASVLSILLIWFAVGVFMYFRQ